MVDTNHIFNLQQYRFPEVYDALYASNPIYQATTSQILREQSLRKLPKSIIDFGCGTGILLSIISKHGFKCWGIDLSDQMVSFCKSKLPYCNIVRADITELPINRLYSEISYATCTYGVHQYIKSTHKLRILFKAVFNLLLPMGAFILQSWDYRKMSKKVLKSVKTGNGYSFSHLWAVNRHPSDLICRIFVRSSDGLLIYDDTHFQYHCDPFLIKNLLYDAGFSIIKLRDASADVEYTANSPSDRAELTAIKY